MTMVNAGLLTFPRLPMGTATAPSSNNRLLDAVGEKLAVVFRAPKTGNIRTIGFSTRTITTGGTVDVRVETVDLATGNPSGTLWATNTNMSVVIDAADDNVWKSGTLTADAAVDQGDLLAVVIVAPSGFNGNLATIELDTSLAFPYTDHFTASWSKLVDAAQMVLGYSDGTYPEILGFFPAEGTMATTSLTTTSLVGNIIQVPFNCKARGIWVTGDFDQQDTVWRVYDSNGSTLLASNTNDANVQASTAGRPHYITLDTELTLSRNTDYYVVGGSTSGNGSTAHYFDVDSNALLEAYAGINTFSVSAATQSPSGTGDWTELNTRRYVLGFVITEIDDGDGTGGGGASSHVF